MLKFCLIASVLAIPLFVSGCAGGVKKRVDEAHETAPTWFETQKEEVFGRGYPEFSSIPVTSPRGPVPQELLDGDERLNKEVEDLDNDPKAMTAQEENLEDPRIWAQKRREEVEKGVPKD
ncbi:hypothetical protein [Hirschia litorea]|uniref:Lipoprotein n=1 Tax=Hirschia litorea TaxID=1199156 RepID=A0ABW2II00_9PROT